MNNTQGATIMDQSRKLRVNLNLLVDWSPTKPKEDLAELVKYETEFGTKLTLLILDKTMSLLQLSITQHRLSVWLYKLALRVAWEHAVALLHHWFISWVLMLYVSCITTKIVSLIKQILVWVNYLTTGGTWLAQTRRSNTLSQLAIYLTH